MRTPIPAGPLTTEDLAALGVTGHTLRRMLADGELRRVFRGVYVAGTAELTVEVRAACLARVVPIDAVVCDHTAAWLHGVDCWPAAGLDGSLPVDLVRPSGRGRTRRSEVYGGRRDLAREDVCTVDGVRVTTPLRTASDLACLRDGARALGVLDAFMTLHGITRSQLRVMVRRFRGRRGVTQFRDLTEVAQPGPESLRESALRLRLLDEGFSCPEIQLEVWLPGHGWVRLDLAYRGRRIAIEYDGEEFHTSDADRRADAVRRRALREAGWIVIVVTNETLDEVDAPWLAELRLALSDRTASRRRRHARAARSSRYVTSRRDASDLSARRT